MGVIRTWARLKEELRARGFRPRRALGQNFLLAPSVLSFMVAEAKVSGGDRVLEVGVGPGTLTGYLLDAGAHVVGVEIERKLVGVTWQQFKGRDLVLVCGDVLAKGKRLNPEVEEHIARMKGEGGYKLVANLPYNVSTTLFIELMRSRYRPSLIVAMVQSDFARRLCASPGSRDYAPVSVFAATFGRASTVRRVDRRNFWPVPGVDSAIVKWVPARDRRFADEDRYFRLVAALFLLRRKKLGNVVKHIRSIRADVLGPDPASLLLRASIDPNRRAESLSVDDFVRLYEASLEEAGGSGKIED